MKFSFNIDLSRNERQRKYFNAIKDACHGANGYKYFAYGGAIRGGKSYVTAYMLLWLAKKYPASRWHVVRQDMPVLEATTIPTFQKLIRRSAGWKWVRDKANYHVGFSNGSKIFFKGENAVRDPLLNDFLGLETNGIWLEQAEELNELMWEKALERTGSWYIPAMPPGFIFLTFNPTQKWVKRKFYEPWVKSALTEPYFYMPALPKDNPFVTEGQWQQWSNMAQPYRQQFVEGDWNDLSDKLNLWAFGYNAARHSGTPALNPTEIVYLSFDFNVNPMCCAVIQHYGGRIYVLEVIKIPNSGTGQMCDYISASAYRRCALMVTGDATGASHNTSQVDSAHNYMIIQRRLGLADTQFRVPASNPALQHNKVLVNSVLQNYPVVIHTEKAKALHYDLANVRTNPDNTIVKTNRSNPGQQCDALDTFRYWCNAYMSWFLRMV